MNVLNNLTIRNLKNNRKRSIGTIIGIILSVSLICAVCLMFFSFRLSLINNAIDYGGYYHIVLYDLEDKDVDILENNKDIETLTSITEYGYSLLEDDERIFINSMTNDDFDNLYDLKEGHFPKNNNEVVITEHMLDEYKLGDSITLDVYDLKTEELIANKEYKVVGISSDNYQFWDSLITTGEDGLVNVYIALDNPFDYKDSFVEILDANNYDEVYNYKAEKYEYYLNVDLLRWEVFSFSKETTITIVLVLTIVLMIIMFTSIYCIKNSFEISITEKIKLYGILSSIGATKKQIKNFVIKEGFFLGLIGIPCGLLIGIIASAILIYVVNAIMVTDAFEVITLCFDFNIIAILLALIVSIFTIYFSCLKSARIASKYSAIEGIRGNGSIKVKKNSLKVPAIVSKLFNMGGVLAYKNLKRSKQKYKTTVISLLVSIAVFISLTTFVDLSMKEIKVAYDYKDYDLVVSSSSKIEEADKVYSLLMKHDDVEEVTINYHPLIGLFINDESKIEKKSFNYYQVGGDNRLTMVVILLDDNSFRTYVKNSKLDYSEVKDRGILFDYSLYVIDGKEYRERIYNYKAGDVIDSKLTDETAFKVTIGGISDVEPKGFENMYPEGGIIILNSEYFNDIKVRRYEMLVKTSDSYGVQDYIKSSKYSVGVINYDEVQRSDRNIVIVVSIFLYGFIGVVSLIGLTNIFNTITSNIELRRREFATLKSIGMTKKEFSRMMNLETILYCSESLLYGSLLGTLASFAIFKSFNYNNNARFDLPLLSIGICAIVVLIIVFIIMRYSINNVNKRNIIDTIRNENI